MASAFIERPGLLAKIKELEAELEAEKAKIAELRKGNDYLLAENNKLKAPK